MHFVFTVVFGLAMVALYVVGRMFKKVSAWANGKPGPSDKPVFYVPLFFCIGCIAGYMFFAPAMNFKTCIDAHNPVATCVLPVK